jgi:hypothetical protein
MDVICKDVLPFVFQHLNVYDLVSCGKVCKLWNQVESSDQIWKEFIAKVFSKLGLKPKLGSKTLYCSKTDFILKALQSVNFKSACLTHYFLYETDPYVLSFYSKFNYSIYLKFQIITSKGRSGFLTKNYYFVPLQFRNNNELLIESVLGFICLKEDLEIHLTKNTLGNLLITNYFKPEIKSLIWLKKKLPWFDLTVKFLDSDLEFHRFDFGSPVVSNKNVYLFSLSRTLFGLTINRNETSSIYHSDFRPLIEEGLKERGMKKITSCKFYNARI